jgi:hypothetical protein
MSRRENDIVAPDGFVLGGLRAVRRDGTVLFQRGWWQAPLEWVGKKVWVHERWVHEPGYGGRLCLEAWPPGIRIYADKADVEILDRTTRADAKPAYRRPEHKAWAEKMAGQGPQP